MEADEDLCYGICDEGDLLEDGVVEGGGFLGLVDVGEDGCDGGGEGGEGWGYAGFAETAEEGGGGVGAL